MSPARITCIRVFYVLRILTNFLMFCTHFHTRTQYWCHSNPSSDSRADKCGQSDGRTDITKVNFVLFISCIIDNRFTTLSKQNTQTCSIYIYIIISHLIFLRAVAIMDHQQVTKQSNTA